MDVLADVGDQTAQRVAAQDGGGNPEGAPKNVVKKIARVRHFCRACNGRAERSDDGDEAREDYGAATVLLVEVMRALEMAASEKEGIFAAVKSGTSGAANPVANLVPRNGAEHDREQEPFERNDSRVGENARSDEQGITRKKKAHEKACFYEKDGANERSAPRAD
jgi:hypothetical protein